jgi:hypothetical protein
MTKYLDNDQKVVIDDLIKNAKISNKSKAAHNVDNSFNYYLNLSNDKENFCSDIITNINKNSFKKKIKDKDYFKSVSFILLGKMFYLKYSNGKYLKIKKLEKLIDKEALVDIITEMESSRDLAWSHVENTEKEELKDFFYGVYTYIYNV